MISKILAFLLLIILSPVLFLLFILVKTTSQGPFIFKQMRAGKNKKIFFIYKMRSMVTNAENVRKNYIHLNEANGPVFKIANDPRYTKIGRILSKTGFDELPQLINIIRGEMSFVGPRPLLINESNKIPKKYQKRFTVLPGITSLWVIKGSHNLSFKEWMELDMFYVKNHSLLLDLYIVLNTIILLSKAPFRLIKNK